MREHRTRRARASHGLKKAVVAAETVGHRGSGGAAARDRTGALRAGAHVRDTIDPRHLSCFREILVRSDRAGLSTARESYLAGARRCADVCKTGGNLHRIHQTRDLHGDRGELLCVEAELSSADLAPTEDPA